MEVCTEFAVFTVAKEKVARAIELSHLIFSEMNQAKPVITASEVLQKTDNHKRFAGTLPGSAVQPPKKPPSNGPLFPAPRSFRLWWRRTYITATLLMPLDMLQSF